MRKTNKNQRRFRGDVINSQNPAKQAAYDGACKIHPERDENGRYGSTPFYFCKVHRRDVKDRFARAVAHARAPAKIAVCAKFLQHFGKERR